VRTPTPRPTATQVPIVEVSAPVEDAAAPASQPVVESPPIVPAEEPALAMAEESAPSADLAQEAAAPPPSDEGASADAPPAADEGRRGGGGRKDAADSQPEEVAVAAAPPVEQMPVPEAAIEAVDEAGGAPIFLPPAPLNPMPPSQAFLPVTPTPVGDGTPTPEPPTQTDAPQLAEDTSDDLGVTALAPAPPVQAPAVTVTENDEIKSKKKRDKSQKDGASREHEQTAYVAEPMGWSADPVLLTQAIALQQTADGTAPDGTTIVPAEPTATTEQPIQIDPATGLQIDAATGLLIDPATGYLLDLVNGLVFHPGTGFQVHPFTGLLIDPVTGAQLDPVTLAVVIPAGFGSDQPAYAPGSDSMRGQIETVVDDTYNNATYIVIPPTDGPVQPVDEIIVPTESGEALEIID
jgi:hypothetical protein